MSDQDILNSMPSGDEFAAAREQQSDSQPANPETNQVQPESTQVVQQQADVNSGSGTGLNPELVDLAKSGAYGFSEQALANFKTDEELQTALLNFDMQPQYPQPPMPQMQQPPMMYPALPQQQYSVGYDQQQLPQPQQPIQQQQPYGQVPNQQQQQPLVDIDPEQMDEKTYKAFQTLAGQVQQQQQMIAQQQQMFEQQQVDRYFAEMNPLIDQLKDPRLDQKTPYGQAQVNAFLQQVEMMRESRQMRGLNPSSAELVRAVHLQFSQMAGQQQNMGSQFIGSPNQQRTQQAPATGDAAALKTIGTFTDSDPFAEAISEDQAIVDSMLD